MQVVKHLSTSILGREALSCSNNSHSVQGVSNSLRGEEVKHLSSLIKDSSLRGEEANHLNSPTKDSSLRGGELNHLDLSSPTKDSSLWVGEPNHLNLRGTKHKNLVSNPPQQRLQSSPKSSLAKLCTVMIRLKMLRQAPTLTLRASVKCHLLLWTRRPSLRVWLRPLLVG